MILVPYTEGDSSMLVTNEYSGHGLKVEQTHVPSLYFDHKSDPVLHIPKHFYIKHRWISVSYFLRQIYHSSAAPIDHHPIGIKPLDYYVVMPTAQQYLQLYNPQMIC